MLAMSQAATARRYGAEQAGIPFEGGAYPQEFALGDVEADGLELGAIHAFGAGRGFAMFFPLGHPRTWRVMAMEAGAQQDAAPHDEPMSRRTPCRSPNCSR